MLGITVLADYLLSEGIDAVLDAIAGRAGATAVACNPTVTVPAAEGEGSFQPPIDGGTSPRLFDRPLWGKRSLWVQAEPSYHPNPKYYHGLKYGPKGSGGLTDRYGHVIREFIDAAHRRGLEVYFQLPAAAPPGFTDEDAPRLPDGSVYQKRFARTASLASPDVVAYNRALVADLLAVYPDIDGIRPDWPEYPCYTLGELFTDFSPHAASETVRPAVGELWDKLHGDLDDASAHWLRDELGVRPPGSRRAETRPAEPVDHWLRLKSQYSLRLLSSWREALDDAGGRGVKLSANAFAPPFSDLTGMDFTGAASICDAVSPKLYTMHWLVIVWLWARELLAANPRLSETACVTAIAEDLGMAPEGAALSLEDVRYPQPDEPHRVPSAMQTEAVAAAVHAAADSSGAAVSGPAAADNGSGAADNTPGAAGRGPALVTPIVHGYGPSDDVRKRFEIAASTAADGVWVNRYGYLSDEKLDAIGGINRRGECER